MYNWGRYIDEIYNFVYLMEGMYMNGNMQKQCL